jgi:hypothetical protein
MMSNAKLLNHEKHHRIEKAMTFKTSLLSAHLSFSNQQSKLNNQQLTINYN